MDRFVKLFSKILDWKHYKQPHYLQVFVALLFRANWKNSYDRSGREIKRGQAIISQREFCDDCGVTRNTLAKILNGLAESGEITIETNNNYSLITIVNYDKFQSINEDIEIVDKEENNSGLISGLISGSVSGSKIEPQGEPPIEPIIEYIEYNRNYINNSDVEKKENSFLHTQLNEKDKEIEELKSKIEELSKTKKEERKQSKPIEERKNDFKELISENRKDYGRDMLNAFYAYWTECDKKGKMRFECERFFDVARRLSTWSRREIKDNKQSKPNYAPSNAPNKYANDISNNVYNDCVDGKLPTYEEVMKRIRERKEKEEQIF